MHPCCGGSLQLGSKKVAIVEIVIAVIKILLTVVGGVVIATGYYNMRKNNEEYGTIYDKETRDYTGTLGTYVIVGSVIHCLVYAGGLCFSILLLVGANQRNRTKCLVWFIFSAVILAFKIIVLLIGFVNVSKHGPAVLIFIFGIILWDSYFMWVVWAFMSELKQPPPVVTFHVNSKA